MSLLRIGRLVVHWARSRRLASLPSEPCWTRVPAGFHMKIHKDTWCGRSIMMGYYESDLVYLIRQVVMPGDGCIDVGANLGYISLHCARQCGAQGRVLSVEASPQVYADLCDNIARNHFPQVIPLNFFAGNRHQDVDFFYDPLEPGNSSYISHSGHEIGVVVPMAPLDELWDKANASAPVPLRFVKIDVEGAEPLVLQGFQKGLSEYPLLWIEVNPPLLQKGGFSMRDLYEMLNQHGYEIYIPIWNRSGLGIPSLRLCPANQQDIDSTSFCNIITFVPRSIMGERIEKSPIQLIRE